MLTDDQIQAMLDARAARAQGVAPERILQRALSAGATTRAASWRPVLSALGGLAVAAAIIGIVVLAGNLGSKPPLPGGVGGSSATPTTVAVASPTTTPAPTMTPTPTATPTPTPVPTPSSTPPCEATQLAAEILDWQGAAGSRIADIRLTNTSATDCKVPAIPGLQLLDAKQAVLIAVAATLQPAPVTVTAGGSLETSVEVSNYCGPDPSLPLTVAFLLPQDHERVIARALASGEAGFPVPPCMGGSGADISMNGWRP